VGAFRNVQVRLLDTGAVPPKTVSIRGNGSAALPHHAFELLDPSRRRVIVVLTDGSGPAWTNGTALGALHSWGRVLPVAIVHLLPQQFWHRTGIRPRRVRLRSPQPGAANVQLDWTARDVAPVAEPGFRADRRQPPIPVLELHGRWLGTWARLVAGLTSGWTDLTAVTAEQPDAPDGDTDGRHRPRQDPHATVAQFRAASSPTAFNLATHLAAAPLNLPVAEMVQAMLLPRSAPHHLSEIFTSGLLHQVTPVDGLHDVERVTLDFDEGVREELLSIARRGDTMRVLRAVDEYLGPLVETVRGLREVVDDPTATVERSVTADTVPFIRVEQAVLHALSGPHLERSRRLRDALDKQSANAVAGVQQAQLTARTLLTSQTLENAMSTTSARDGHMVASAGSPEDRDTGTGTNLPGGGTEVVIGSPAEARRRSAAHQPAVWGNIPPRNPNFTGRVKLLNGLHDRLNTGTTAVLPEALHGMGGVGKSQLAIEYVYRHQEDYDLVWWIPSERPAQIRQALSELAQRLELPVGAEVNAAVPAVREALRIGKPYSNWLLVFDNAESPEAVRPFFPTGGPGCILVTSRDPRWASLARSLEVDIFTRAESTELLRRRGPELSLHDADRLAVALGDLPLAIEQAAAWRAETGMPADEYLRLLEEKRPELLDDARPLGYPTTVAAAWNVSLDALKERNPGALQLLQLCAFLAPEPISRTLFTGARGSSIVPELDETLRDPIQFSRAVREINRYGLARIDHRTNSLQMHRLVQRVLSGQMTEEQREIMGHGAHLLLAASDPNLPDTAAHWPRYSELYPHVIASGAIDCDDGWVRQLVLNEAKYLWRWGDPEGSREISQRAHDVWRRQLGEEHAETLEMARWLGFMLFTGARYAEAADLNARTLDKFRRALGEDHEGTLEAMQAVAADRRVQGEFGMALEISDTVYRRSIRLFGADDPITLKAAHNLGVSLRLAGEFKQAQTLDLDTYQRSVQIFGEDHPDSLYTRLGLILDQRELGEYAGACVALEELVAKHRLLLGENNFFTLRAVRTLSVTRRKAGDHLGALACSEDARNRFATQYGPDYPETMAAELDLSTDRRQNNDLRSAREFGLATYERYVRTLGEGHPHTVGAAVNLAVTQRLLGAVDEAYATDSEALLRLRSSIGEAHVLTLSCAINVASDLYARSDFQQAYDQDIVTLERLREKLFDDHPLTLACAINFAIDLRALGRQDEADTVYSDTMARFKRVLGPNHPATREAADWVRAACDMYPMPL
jgi:hypothetical protein